MSIQLKYKEEIYDSKKDYLYHLRGKYNINLTVLNRVCVLFDYEIEVINYHLDQYRKNTRKLGKKLDVKIPMVMQFNSIYAFCKHYNITENEMLIYCISQTLTLNTCAIILSKLSDTDRQREVNKKPTYKVLVSTIKIKHYDPKPKNKIKNKKRMNHLITIHNIKKTIGNNAFNFLYRGFDNIS